MDTHSNSGTESDCACRDPIGSASCVSLWCWDSHRNALHNLTVNILAPFFSWLFSRSPHEMLSIIRNLMSQASVSKGRCQALLRAVNPRKQGLMVEALRKAWAQAGAVRGRSCGEHPWQEKDSKIPRNNCYLQSASYAGWLCGLCTPNFSIPSSETEIQRG